MSWAKPILLQQGQVPLARILAPAAMGESRPVGNDKTGEGQAENRRVVVRVLQDKANAGVPALGTTQLQSQPGTLQPCLHSKPAPQFLSGINSSNGRGGCDPCADGTPGSLKGIHRVSNVRYSCIERNRAPAHCVLVDGKELPAFDAGLAGPSLHIFHRRQSSVVMAAAVGRSGNQRREPVAKFRILCQ